MTEEKNMQREQVLAQALTENAQPMTGAPEDFDALLEMIGDARCFLIGEATHGTPDGN